MISISSLLLLALFCSLSTAKENNFCHENDPPEECTSTYNETIRTSKYQPPQDCLICCAAASRKACVEDKCGNSYNTQWGLDIPTMCNDHWMYNSTSSPVCWSTAIWTLLGALCIILFLVVALIVGHIIEKREERNRPLNSIEARPSALKKVSIQVTHNTKRVAFAPEEPQPGPSCRAEFQKVVAQVHPEPANCGRPFDGIPGDESRIPMIDKTDDEVIEEETQV